jgi:hypothetical protein
MTRDELYAVPPPEFVRARNALVKELREAGDRDEAAEVASLRRPARSLWVVNRVARRDAADVAGLLDAGAALHSAQKKLLRGGDTKALRDAESDLRARVAALVLSAKELLSEDGAPTEALLRRVAETLRAAATGDDALRAALKKGVLDFEPDPSSGFELAGIGKLPARRKTRPRPAPKPQEDAREKKRREALARKAAKLREQARKLADRAREAEEAAASHTLG